LRENWLAIDTASSTPTTAAARSRAVPRVMRAA
jgi:hypothetical protein